MAPPLLEFAASRPPCAGGHSPCSLPEILPVMRSVPVFRLIVACLFVAGLLPAPARAAEPATGVQEKAVQEKRAQEKAAQEKAAQEKSVPPKTDQPRADSAKPAPILYISDQLTAPLRAGAAREQKIINQVKAGEQVEIMERATGTGFVRIRAASGPEGWIEADRVVNVQPALNRYAELQARFDAAVAELEDTRSALPDREALERRNHDLQVRVVQMENEVEALKQQNAKLSERFDSEVMYAGALIVLGGALLGFILGAMRNRRRDGWR